MSLDNGIYKHYKGNLYQVLGVARHSETEEAHVVYRTLYGDHSIRLQCRVFRDQSSECFLAVFSATTYELQYRMER